MTIDNSKHAQTNEIADRIYDGEITITEAQALVPGSVIVDGLLILRPGVWVAMDEGLTEVEFEAATAREAAEAFVDGCNWQDWATENTTFEVSVWREGITAEGEIVRAGEDFVTVVREVSPRG